MAEEKIIVQLASPERIYVRVYHDFLDNSFLSAEEQMIFIVLKSYVNFKEDSGEVFPSMETICKRAKMGEKRARKNINSLIKKGIAKKVQRGLTRTNLYTLADYATMWTCDKIEDVAEIANNYGQKPMTVDEHIAALKRMGYEVEIKEKEPDKAAPTKVTAKPSTLNDNLSKNNHSTGASKNQDGVQERYTLDEIKEIFNYDAMIQDNPYQQQEIDSVMNILYTNLNTIKPTIRVGGEDKPSMVVIGKLMKLDYPEIMYCIEKYSEQTERIKNPTSYMLTLLYNAKEQMNLDITNQVQNNRAHWNQPTEK